ncbi:MAG TPA: hypothetical protein VL354_05730 [Spirochaetia bacterium]|nr:hypothetical protein [Spirochaetia bacterium]
MQDRSRIARLLKDLDEIKAAVKRNSPVLREIVTARFYWWLILVFGAAVTVFSVVMHFLVIRFGGYEAIPGGTRTVFWVLAAAAGVVMYVFRVRGVLLTIRKMDRRLTFWSLLGDHTVGEFFHVYGPLSVISLAATIYLSRTGNAYYIVGVWALHIGLTWNLIGFAVHLVEFYVIGYWCLLVAALSIFLPGVSASLWIAICAGGWSITYAVVSGLVQKGERTAGRSDG